MTAAAITPVTLDVSRNGLIRTLGDQFTSRTTFISELMQNARRAGASRVEIEYTPETGVMVFRDDGSGITSPQALFTIGQSGWDDIELMERENPFGIGFASAIFASTAIKISTVGWCVELQTADLLSFRPVDVLPGNGFQGTELTLQLKAELAEYFANAHTLTYNVEQLAAGFGIPVVLNGQPLARPNAEDDSFIPFEYGRVRCMFDPATPSLEATIYLQGFEIKRPHRYGVTPFIVHLDPQAFRARVPDRDTLIDQNEALAKIKQAIRNLWLEEIRSQRERLSVEVFVKTYAEAICSLRFERKGLLDDLPLAPTMWGKYLQAASHERDSGDAYTWISCETELLEKTTDIIEMIDYEDECDSPAAIYALKLQWPVLSKGLNDEHWATQAAIDLKEIEFSITPKGVVAEHSFSCSRSYPFTVVFCESFELAPAGELPRDGLPSFEVTDHAVWCPNAKKVYAPRGSINEKTIDLLMMQMISFDDDDSSREDDMISDDIRDFIGLANISFGQDPTTTIKQVLLDISDTFRSSLAGQQFSLSFNEKGVPVIARLDS